MRHLQHHHGVAVGTVTANGIKHSLGTALPSSAGPTLAVKGRDVDSGFPRNVSVAQVDVGAALQESVQLILDAIVASMEHTPPDLAADIAATGIVLAGGCARLKDLDRAVGQATGLAVVVAEEPASCTVRGASMALQNQTLFRATAG